MSTSTYRKPFAPPISGLQRRKVPQLLCPLSPPHGVRHECAGGPGPARRKRGQVRALQGGLRPLMYCDGEYMPRISSNISLYAAPRAISGEAALECGGLTPLSAPRPGAARVAVAMCSRGSPRRAGGPGPARRKRGQVRALQGGLRPLMYCDGEYMLSGFATTRGRAGSRPQKSAAKSAHSKAGCAR
jgi:hypothetical protein